MYNARFPYSDIIKMRRPVHKNDDFSMRHPPMKTSDRAKIFSPFAALRGFGDAIEDASDTEDHTVYMPVLRVS